MLFSVIIPCFNASGTLERLFDSLNRQTFRDFEVICIDDSSTDHTSTVVQEYKQSHDLTICLVRNAKNSGPGVSRNKGISLSKGKYLCFMDSDDFIDDHYFERVSSSIQETSADIVFFGTKQVLGHVIRPRPCAEFNSVREAMAMCGGSLWGACWRKELFNGLSLPDIRNAEDIAVIPVLISRAERIMSLPDLLYCYVHRNTSLSSTCSPNVSYSFVKSFEYTKSMIDVNKFYNEVEFHGIKTVLYGATLVAIKAGMNNREIESLWSVFLPFFRTWVKNPYLKTFPGPKKWFVKAVRRKSFSMLRLYASLHTRILSKIR